MRGKAVGSFANKIRLNQRGKEVAGPFLATSIFIGFEPTCFFQGKICALGTATLSWQKQHANSAETKTWFGRLGRGNRTNEVKS